MAFGGRLRWARDWVYGNTPTPKANSEPDLADYQIIDHEDVSSHDGVRSLPETYATTDLSQAFLVRGEESWEATYHSDPASIGFDPISSFNTSAAITRKEATALERAGRHSDQHTFADLRSGAKVRLRSRKQSQKYYGHRYVKPGDLATTSSKKTNTWRAKTALQPGPFEDMMPIIASTKKQLYELAQRYPRPPTYHRRRMEKEYSPWSQKCRERLDARKHADQVVGDAVDEAKVLASDLEHWETCSICAWPFASSQDLPSHVPHEFDEEPARERQEFTLGQLLGDQSEG